MMEPPFQEGNVYRHPFSFSQAEVMAFAQVTGDTNPVHLDPEYAKQTVFRRPIMHGMLAGSVFSKVFGTLFPGEGTIYLKQDLQFIAPMYVDEQYEAVLTISALEPARSKAMVRTQIIHLNSGKTVVEGAAEIINRQQLRAR